MKKVHVNAETDMQNHEAIALNSIQAIAASFGTTFDAEKILDTVVEKVILFLKVDFFYSCSSLFCLYAIFSIAILWYFFFVNF